MVSRIILSLCLLLAISLSLSAQDSQNSNSEDSLELKLLEPAIETIALPEDFDIIAKSKHIHLVADIKGNVKSSIYIGGKLQSLDLKEGAAKIDLDNISRKGALYKFQGIQSNSSKKIYHISKRADNSFRVKPIPLILSIIPPLLAIILALLFKEVILALFMGIFSGAFIAGGLRFEAPLFYLESAWLVLEKYILNALNDGGHLSIVLFSLLIGGMVAIISRNGGMAGVVTKLSRFAKGPESSQFVTWLLGVAIFFDDYANTLIVGNTMRSVTDKFRVSREKLAYIVDSTAAPVAAIAFITTWIGAELSYISDGVKNIEGFSDVTSYSLFLSSLKYSFYPILTLIFILLVIFTKRDFGPMLKAELRARKLGKVKPDRTDEHEENLEDLSPVKGAPLKPMNAILPVLTVIFVTIFGLLSTGFESTYGSLIADGLSISNETWGATWTALNEQQDGFFVKLGTLIGNSDSYIALLWASLSGVIVALILTISQKIMKLERSIGTMIDGFKTMLPALIILTMAWALAGTTDDLETAHFLSSTLANNINPFVFPVIVFILAASIAFSTGSSWSTMAILYPLAIPTCWSICQSQGIAPDVTMELMLNSIAIVLGASVLGDHCSPISDTTILSSLASDCNHIEHVRTQLPYALTVGIVAISCTFLSTFLGGGILVSIILILLSVLVLYLILLKFGTKHD
ncbi:MAG: Na+/H+ antiporter NhaC family protein [Saprospiraceae bacterium]|nr:Na+/H+ antiporter NhaC family protein [Saprospiraceae bacterium]